MKALFGTLGGTFCAAVPALAQNAPHQDLAPLALKWMDDRHGSRIPEPPAEHPRLYLRARDMPDLRRLTHPVTGPA